MLMRLLEHRVFKPWGRTDIPRQFGGPTDDRLGEIWFQREDGSEDDPLLVKYLFTSEWLSVQIHPDDASKRGIANGQTVNVFNARGRFRATAVLADTVKPGVVVSLGLYWRRYTNDGVNCNSTTSTAITDLGGGATFFDNLVDVATI